MALINRPMYEQFGARHLGVKGPGALTNLEEGVMGVLPLDLASDPMYWFLQGIKAFSGIVGIGAGGAGNYGKVGLSIETANQDIIVRIIGAWVKDPTSAIAVQIRRCARTDFSSDPGTYGTGIDTRIPEAQDSQAIFIKAADSAYPGTAIGGWRVGLNQFLPTEMPLIISPTQAIFFQDLTADQDFEMTLVWVEMPAYRGEL